MSDKPGHLKAQVRMGQDAVSVRPIGYSDATIAKVLGVTLNDDGTSTYYLDRLVHQNHIDSIGVEGAIWKVEGCFVTEMTGPFGS